MFYTCFFFYLWTMFWNRTLDQTTTRNWFSSQNQIRTSYYIVCYSYLLESYFRSFDYEIDISTLKTKLNHQNNARNKWNESGFRPPLCTYRLNWARRTSWGWWDDWDDTVLQTQDSKFEPWRSEAEHATSRSRRLPTILTFTRGWGRNNFVSFKPPRPGTEPRTLAWNARNGVSSRLGQVGYLFSQKNHILSLHNKIDVLTLKVFILPKRNIFFRFWPRDLRFGL